MRCDNCPLCPIADDDVCPESEGEYGIEHADGMLGCKHPRNWAEKKSRECDEHYGTMGTDMGIEMDFTPEELEKVIDLCKHMVGLDRQKPYHRHGKAFYRPYRNFFASNFPGNRLLKKTSGLDNHQIAERTIHLSQADSRGLKMARQAAWHNDLRGGRLI